jgi:hypothetical protein
MGFANRVRAVTRSATRALGAVKLAVGGAFLVAPQLATEWAGRDARRRGTKAVTRMFGVRDAAFGAGLLTAPIADGDLRRWLLISSACDAVDFGAALTLPASRGRSVMLAAAASATVTQLALAARAR